MISNLINFYYTYIKALSLLFFIYKIYVSIYIDTSDSYNKKELKKSTNLIHSTSVRKNRRSNKQNRTGHAQARTDTEGTQPLH